MWPTKSTFGIYGADKKIKKERKRMRMGLCAFASFVMSYGAITATINATVVVPSYFMKATCIMWDTVYSRHGIHCVF